MKNILKVSDITQQFGGLTALKNVNMEVHEREIVGVIGPNGAGKTTLFNIITGIYKPTEGTVHLLDHDITGIKPYKIVAKGFSRTFQNIRLFPRMTVLDNVLLGMHTRTKSSLVDAIFHTKRKRKEEEESIKKACEILKIFDLYENRYDLSTSLAYGSQRKVEIARALASDPKLLLLDEPAAGMNGQETEDLMNIIKKLQQMGYTILLIEHDIKFIMNICERIYVLNYGIPIANGTAEEIKVNPVVIEAYLGK